MPALQVDASLFTTDDNSGTYAAWNIFRNIANVAFVAMFIIIIFSQVTGFGVDKYGIKKALPKLIVAVVLINLSYLICQLAVDVGNIVGRQVGSFFQTISKDISQVGSQVVIDNGDNTTTTVPSSAWEGFLNSFTGSVWNIALVVIIGLITFAAILSQGWAIIIPVLLALVSIAIAIVGLIVILGIRQAAAVLLVAVSPLAFVCYTLPNTKKIYQRWFKAFSGLLIAFPICSALVYGGDMASTILLNTVVTNTTSGASMWLIIAAGVVSVAPIFFIPKVISSSMGAISGGMMALTNKARGKARGAVGKSLDRSPLTKYRNYKQTMRDQRATARTNEYNARKGQKLVDKYDRKGVELTGNKRLKYNAAKSAVNLQKQESENAYSSSFEGLTDAQKKKRIYEAAGLQLDEHGNLMRDSSGNLIQKKGAKLNGDMLVAGLRSMENSAEMNGVLRDIHQTNAFRGMMKGDGAMQKRLANVMRGSEGNAINQGIGDLMADGRYSVDEILDKSTGLLRDKVSGYGAGIVGSQKAELFDTEGAADYLSDDQLSEFAASELSGAHQEKYYQMMKNQVSDSRKSRMLGNMTSSKIGRLRTSYVDGEDHGTLAAVGGAALVKSSNPDAIEHIKSEDGAQIRMHQQGDAARQLGTNV